MAIIVQGYMVQQVAGENVDIKPRETKTFTWGVLSDSSQPRMSSVNSNEETSGEAGEEEDWRRRRSWDKKKLGEEEVGEAVREAVREEVGEAVRETVREEVAGEAVGEAGEAVGEAGEAVGEGGVDDKQPPPTPGPGGRRRRRR